jgi:cytochrome c
MAGHSASIRAFTPVFDGLWTRVNALMSPAIHVFDGAALKTWMPATSAGMTRKPIYVGTKRWSVTLVSLMAIAAAMAMLSSASAQDVERGKVLFEQCVACHSFEETSNEVGPHLKGLFGRRTAAVDNFIYSPAFRRANGVWTPELLDDFLKEPQAPPFRGNRMPFSGMPDAQARADLIAYLKEAAR